ncbi:hypothetical protein ABZ787_05200 [Micrococcus luteus]|jgi:hypothetical protein|uniref:Serine/arginine repetitive matrix protein 2 n=2 Tax=Micrococcus luteus TaxID=1270 RepID=A0AAX0VHR3_MICLU|nr:MULTISPECIES: hypothetical protein [Micrococcales]OFT25765.1 hypothetical protein HMPREF3102_02210 [Micrococcus sp. HMSC30C05]OOL30195.1 hypothetical protein GQ85_21365 [Rhodococcus rhodochrous]MBY0170831.1 hypothetical protein [Micrococcus luteus]MBY0173596.1 hypothetical protein [Micrococcus luteus]MBY0179727.1 hypothetical protein [Micrococcus luteus]
METATARKRRERFDDSEALRALLTRLHEAGRGAWRHDPEAAALMEHAASKYAALARKHGLDPWEAASAAFEAMRGAATRRAEDPWAVITRAVQVTCTAEERGNGLLCSVHQARRPRYSVFHDAERFSDRENPLPDYHPAFRFDPFTDDEPDDEDPAPERAVNVTAAIEDTIAFLTRVGWEPETARAAVEYVTARLTEASSRASAFEVLRRDRQARALLDLPGASWTALLRAVLGVPDPALAHTNAGRGMLRRLLIGQPLRALLTDDDLVITAGLAAPRFDAGSGGR